MCSFFSQKMESGHQGGDLGDIIRASGCGGGELVNQSTSIATSSGWKLPPETVVFSPQPPGEGFGDPFSSLPDPLLHELAGTTASPLFDSSDATASSGLGEMGVDSRGNGDGGSSTLLAAGKILGEEMGRPGSIFSRVLQISPSTNLSPMVPRGVRPPLPPILVGDMMKMSGNGSNPAMVCGPLDHSGVQISPPRAPGIKRRKSQAKKVVCIPAPAAAGSRPTGEVVPSDLWAWRKYGQKPIKGSPYPRGYYRCSSSKGCSARKQVERSRTDPNMLVITYTSEHNHPWPTQRNALAGSTRSQPTKNPKNQPSNDPTSTAGGNEELKDGNAARMSTPVKEEAAETMELASMDADDDNDLEHVLGQSYKPMFPELMTSHSDDFFADLGGLDTDPMDLIFSKGFLGEKGDVEMRHSKALDPFGMFDWGGNSFGDQAKKGGL